MMHRWLTTGVLVATLIAAAPGRARAQTGWGIAVLQSGSLYFCDGARDRVWKLSPDGNLTVALEGTHCRALVAGPDDAVYGESVDSAIASSAQLGVWRIDDGGGRRWLQRPSFSPEPGIWIVVDRQGRSYSWNGAETGANTSQIIRRDASGAMLALAGGPWGSRDGSGDMARFGHVAGLALAPDGSLVVLDTGNVRRVDAVGRVHSEAMGVATSTTGGSPLRAGLWDYSVGLATDTDGSAVIVDEAARRIVRVARDGRATLLWQSGGFLDTLTRGAFGWRPEGVAMLGSSYYVLEVLPVPTVLADLIGSPRIRQVGRDGKTTEVAAVSGWITRTSAALLLVTVLSWASTARRRRRMAPVPPLPPARPHG